MSKQTRKAYLKIRGLTPIKAVLGLLCLMVLLETLVFLKTSAALGEPPVLTTPALLITSLTILLLIVTTFLCFISMSRIKKRMRYYQEHNAMTNLPNRTFFHRDFKHQLIHATEAGEALAVIVVRLDDYDDLNYTLGHKITDAIIQKIFSTIEHHLTYPDLICLLTSRSFVVGYTNTNKEQAIEKAQAILNLFKHGVETENCHVDINLHCGVTYFPEHGHTPETLIQKAALARSLAMQTHARVSLYDPKLDPFDRMRLSLMSELLTSLQENHFHLYYQPKISIQTLKTIQVETLIRWKHPKHGFMNPDDFIPIAEKTGYINDLAIWLLKGAIEQCRNWCARGYDIRVAINLSTENLMSEKVISQIPVLIERYKVNPKMVILEITESAVMKEPDKIINIIQKLAKAGFAFAIDDFGTGYSSLEYLKKLPISELKIDKAFVQNIDRDEKDKAIVEGATRLAHSMKMGVVAEGVETKSAVEMLKVIGCDKLQGYFFSKPLPIDQFETWLQTSQWGLPKTP